MRNKSHDNLNSPQMPDMQHGRTLSNATYNIELPDVVIQVFASSKLTQAPLIYGYQTVKLNGVLFLFEKNSVLFTSHCGIALIYERASVCR